tara:strand:+ start:116 stop:817 length:702 start_codon:yes stop_codon:yes gene_type:complete
VKYFFYLFFLTFYTNSFSQFSGDGWDLYDGYSQYLNKIPKEISEKFIYKIKTKEKKVVLTFDDGPNKNTKQIIDFLVENNIPSTFFLISNQISEKNKNLYDNKLIDIGIHSFNHKNFDKLSKEEIESDFKKSINIFKKYKLNYTYFRPPYGIINQNMMSTIENFNLKGILWSIDSEDWNLNNMNEIILKSTKNIGPGSIILFHDHINLNTLKKIVSKILDNGYEIVPLSSFIN